MDSDIGTIIECVLRRFAGKHNVEQSDNAYQDVLVGTMERAVIQVLHDYKPEYTSKTPCAYVFVCIRCHMHPHELIMLSLCQDMIGMFKELQGPITITNVARHV